LSPAEQKQRREYPVLFDNPNDSRVILGNLDGKGQNTDLLLRSGKDEFKVFQGYGADNKFADPAIAQQTDKRNKALNSYIDKNAPTDAQFGAYASQFELTDRAKNSGKNRSGLDDSRSPSIYANEKIGDSDHDSNSTRRAAAARDKPVDDYINGLLNKVNDPKLAVSGDKFTPADANFTKEKVDQALAANAELPADQKKSAKEVIDKAVFEQSNYRASNGDDSNAKQKLNIPITSTNDSQFRLADYDADQDKSSRDWIIGYGPGVGDGKTVYGFRPAENGLWNTDPVDLTGDYTALLNEDIKTLDQLFGVPQK
jgi:hypothetical protein